MAALPRPGRCVCRCLLLALGVCSAGAGSQRLDSDKVLESRPFLRWERPAYRNYALRTYANYPDHTFPYADSPRTYYGPLGDYLTSGFDLYRWNETRMPGQEFGSTIFKPNDAGTLVWNKVYDAVVIGRDGYGDWGYSLIVADGLIARFSPLTLSMTDFNGVRLDVSTPRLQLTGLASRSERPHTYISRSIFVLGQTHIADDSTLLLGGRAQTDLGLLRLGLNWANTHVYQSTRPGNSLKGVLRPDQPLMDWILVRFSDDSPADGSGGAVVQEVRLVIDGDPRPDLEPRVIRQRAGVGPQVGTVSQATGRFRATDYTSFRGHRLFYRGRDEVPLYSDFFYLLDHEDGIDVSSDVHLQGLITYFQVENEGETLRADGEEQLVYLFDLSAEPKVESVQVEALVGNDYRVDVALLSNQSPRAKTYHARYLSTFYRTALRARDNVGDLSNLRWVRFDVGENTGLFTYSADLNLALPGLEINGEFGRSALYSRYPGQGEGEPIFSASPHFAERGSAWYLNAVHWLGRGRVGGEWFSINPGYTTSMRTFLDKTSDLNYSNISGMLNETVYWDLVQDNDDGDRFPDRRVGNIGGFLPDEKSFDLDGVFIDQDDDNDGIPEINRNLNNVPDFDEPFLMFDVEPNVYVYGLDRNHNDEPDRREDDDEVDYPYDHDQRGYHLFGQIDPSRHLSLALGRYATGEIAGSGRNRSTYALLTYRRRGMERSWRLFFENHLRRVQDDIGDDYVVTDENASRVENFSSDGLRQEIQADKYLHHPPIFSGALVADLRSYQDSYVNETCLEGRFSLWTSLEVVQKLRLRFNWQQGGRLYNGLFQRERRLDLWTWVNRVQYTWRLGRLHLVPQYKFMLLRLTDQDRGIDLRSEFRSIPILRLEYPLLSRTSLRAGVQGWGPLPYRRRDGLALRNRFEQRTAFATLTNRSKYFGYDLVTIVGMAWDRKEYDAEFQRFRAFDSRTFFARTLVGFTEFGRPL